MSSPDKPCWFQNSCGSSPDKPCWFQNSCGDGSKPVKTLVPSEPHKLAGIYLGFMDVHPTKNGIFIGICTHSHVNFFQNPKALVQRSHPRIRIPGGTCALTRFVHPGLQDYWLVVEPYPSEKWWSEWKSVGSITPHIYIIYVYIYIIYIYIIYILYIYEKS